jgi:isopentenyl phosphate kinase
MIFLKLGGSLITRKDQPQTPRLDVISRLAGEIAEAYRRDPHLKLLLGHGSGSFGHPVADRYQTQLGASSQEEWLGFAAVWKTANHLNRLVMDALLQAGLPALSFPPSASAISDRRKIVEYAPEPIRRALDAGLLPVVQGDVAFDREQGATILSTETVFQFLAPLFRPSLVLLAGIEPGVYKDYPYCEEILPMISDENIEALRIAPAATIDVTGGMQDKVHQAFALCHSVPGLEVRIFSGKEEGTITKALAGESVGTLISTITLPFDPK